MDRFAARHGEPPGDAERGGDQKARKRAIKGETRVDRKIAAARVA